MVDYILQKLKKIPGGSISAAQLGSDINKNETWSSVMAKAGGLKSFCLDHADKITWISEGSGKVQIFQKSLIPVEQQKVCVLVCVLSVFTCLCLFCVRVRVDMRKVPEE